MRLRKGARTEGRANLGAQGGRVVGARLLGSEGSLRSQRWIFGSVSIPILPRSLPLCLDGLKSAGI